MSTIRGVYHLSIRGDIFHAGGIAGSAGGSRLYSADGTELPIVYGGNIQGNFVHRFNGRTMNSAGGIVGEASTDAANAMISNNYAMNLTLSAGVFADTERTIPIMLGTVGGVVGTDGNETNGHRIINTIAPTGLRVIGSRVTSDDDSSENGTVWLAPAPAFFQEGILEILNRNAIHPAEPGVIFTGNFVFAGDGRNSTDGEDGGRLPFPSDIAELLLRFYDGG